MQGRVLNLPEAAQVKGVLFIGPDKYSTRAEMTYGECSTLRHNLAHTHTHTLQIRTLSKTFAEGTPGIPISADGTFVIDQWSDNVVTDAFTPYLFFYVVPSDLSLSAIKYVSTLLPLPPPPPTHTYPYHTPPHPFLLPHSSRTRFCQILFCRMF